MTGTQLGQFRKRSKRTQVEAARVLGVSQTYLSLLEKGKRPLTNELRAKAVRAFHLPPTEMPVSDDLADVRAVSDAQLATDLATLGYPGFSYLKKGKAKNPSVVLLSALKADNREARAVEALPWVVLAFPDMDWTELIKAAKANDLQNRLGFVTSLAHLVAEHRGDRRKTTELKNHAKCLQRSLLAREDTLCNESMTKVERKWLNKEQTDLARRWHLFSNLSESHLRYYDE